MKAGYNRIECSCAGNNGRRIREERRVIIAKPGTSYSPSARLKRALCLSAPLLGALLPFFGTHAGERVTLNFNPDWKFLKADPPGAQQASFDDRTWTNVSTPHTFNDTDTFDDWS